MRLSHCISMYSLRIFLLIQSHLKYIVHVLCHINTLQMINIKKINKTV